MRLIIPEEISKKLEMQEPYLHYVKGQGMVLVDDAPEEIVKLRKETLEWFDQQTRFNKTGEL